MNGVPGMLLVLVILGGVLLGLRRLVRNGRIPAEVSRKTVHVALGVTTLLFPWLFASSRPVWILAGLSVLALSLVRWARPVAAAERQVLLGVSRESYGELCFPVAVAVIFELSGGRPAHYLPAVAALTFADAAGALVGRRFGRTGYSTDEGQKSLEGSLAVMLITGAITAVIAHVFDGAAPVRSLAIGALVGLLTALLEAIAIKGFDNLFIPLLVWALLERYAELDLHSLGLRLAGLMMIAAASVFWLRRTRLNYAGILGVALLLYLAFVLGGWRWGVPPMLAGAVYLWLGRRSRRRGEAAHTLTRAFALAGPGLIWLILGRIFPLPLMLACFTVSFAAAVATMALAEWGRTGEGGLRSVLSASLFGAVVGGAGVGAVWLDAPERGTAILVIAIAAVIAAGAFHLAEWRRPVDHAREARWFIQGGITAATSLLGGLIR